MDSDDSSRSYGYIACVDIGFLHRCDKWLSAKRQLVLEKTNTSEHHTRSPEQKLNTAERVRADDIA